MLWEEFQESLDHTEPDGQWPLPIQALWWEAHQDWDRAHELCVLDRSAESNWVHAFLHRCEGDLGNAEFWYTRAGLKANHDLDLAVERETIQKEICQRLDAAKDTFDGIENPG